MEGRCGGVRSGSVRNGNPALPSGEAISARPRSVLLRRPTEQALLELRRLVGVWCIRSGRGQRETQWGLPAVPPPRFAAGQAGPSLHWPRPVPRGAPAPDASLRQSPKGATSHAGSYVTVRPGHPHEV
ncbi:hypothetical protein GCM10010398_74090 [Streptomyces fimbriatus]